LSASTTHEYLGGGGGPAVASAVPTAWPMITCLSGRYLHSPAILSMAWRTQRPSRQHLAIGDQPAARQLTSPAMMPRWHRRRAHHHLDRPCTVNTSSAEEIGGAVSECGGRRKESV